MRNFEKFTIENIKNLKQPTIFFWLKNQGFSENYIKHLRKENMVFLNNIPVNIRAKINNGDLLEIAQNPNRATKIQKCDGKLEILFEDGDFLIVNKPHNLACMPTRSHFANNLGGQICAYMGNDFTLRIVNRLDRETAGIVVIAKNVIASNNIKLEKEYHALSHGIINEKMTINQPILTIQENGINQQKRIISPLGKPSITHVHPIKIYKDRTLIKLILETGRTHQIRVHLSHIGHPLVGDTLYGRINPSHTYLILKKISFIHFRTKETLSFEVNYPEDWKTHLK